MSFLEFLQRIPTVSAEELRPELDRAGVGDVMLLDVREAAEYAREHLPGARHIPLSQLTDRAGEIDHAARIVTYCGAGRRSRSAASILIGQGFPEVRSLEGGIAAWNGPLAQGEYDHGLFLLGEGPTPVQALAFALALEEGSQVFYERMRGLAPGAEARALLDSLVQAEERHRALLLGAQVSLPGGPAAGREAHGDTAADWMEGAVRIEEAVAWAATPGRSVRDIFDLAMQIEANSLDLYLKMARRDDLAALRATLHRLIEEEKGHLRGLGARLDRLPV